MIIEVVALLFGFLFLVGRLRSGTAKESRGPDTDCEGLGAAAKTQASAPSVHMLRKH
jgi:hypothetical protein